MPSNSHLHKTNDIEDKVNTVFESRPLEKRGEVSDIQLWQEFQAGSELAFSTISELHVEKLYSYGLKLVRDHELVKDCIQDLFIELWDTKHKLGLVRSIKSYLYKSIRRKLLSQVSKKRKTNCSTELEKVTETTASIEKSLIEKQRFDNERAALSKELQKLSGKQREIIHLKYYCRLSYDEISEIMALDKKGIYNLMAHTLKLLKNQLNLFSK